MLSIVWGKTCKLGRVEAPTTAGLASELHSYARDRHCARSSEQGTLTTPGSSGSEAGLAESSAPGLPARPCLVQGSGCMVNRYSTPCCRHSALPQAQAQLPRSDTLNVGHMSAFLWSELKAYLGSSSCDHDVICLQELHWSQTCQFCVGGWSAVVSAGPDRSDGVMVLVSPKFRQSQVKYDEIVRGRLLRVQIAVNDIRVEVFCCYQYVWQSELTRDDNLRSRQSILDKLCAQVRAIARRSTVVVLGDFNAELVPSPGRVGQSLANTPRHVGPEAPSPHALTRALEEMELIALNTWCLRTPHTNFTSTGKSQIDFIWVREVSADRVARRCQPMDPEIGSWRYMGHKKLEASIRLIKHFHLVKPQGGPPGVDKHTLSEHVRINHPSISELRNQVRAALSRGRVVRLRRHCTN